MLKKSWSILYGKLLNEIGQDFLDIQYPLYLSIYTPLKMTVGEEECPVHVLCVQEVVTHFI